MRNAGDTRGYGNLNRRKDIITNRMLASTMAVVTIVMFAGSVGSVVDVLVIGRFLGQREISASAIVLPAIGIVSVIATIFGNGMQLILSEVIARGDKKRASEVFTTNLISVFVITSAAAVFLFAKSPAICSALGLTGKYADLEPLGTAYCRGYAIGIPFFGAAISINQSLQLDGDRTLGLLAVIISTVFNITGDIICAAVIHTGLFGLALVTSVSNIVMFAVILCHYRPGRINLLLFRLSDFRIKDTGALVARGIPNAILITSELVRGVVMNRTLLHISDDVHVAAVSIMSSVNILQTSLLSGFFAAVSVISGVVAGEDDKKGLDSVMKNCIKTGGVLSGFLILFTIVFAGILPDIFINHERVTSIAELALRITVFSVPFRILSGVIIGMYQGLKYTKLSSVEYIVRDIVIPSVCMIVFGLSFGPVGMFVGMIVAYAISLALVILYPLIRMRDTSIGLPYRLMLLKNSDVTYDSFEGSVSTLEEVSVLSEEIRQYCIEVKCNKRMALITSLAVEEMCNNALTHNNADGRKHCMDIILRKREDEHWILRICDDYRLFDPGEWLKSHEGDFYEDPTRNIGIRMIYNLADDVMYTQLMQMNNLTIVFSG